MNVLLLYPKFPDTFWSFTHALKFIRKKAAFPPLGLLTVAAMLPSAWPKRLVDTNVCDLAARDLEWADIVFIGAMIAQRASVVALLARCRAAGKRIVAGGPLFTSEHAQFPEVDHFVLNEAEITLPPFLEDLAAGHARAVYRTFEYPDLAATPIPLWRLADLRCYASMCVQFSRGCPFDCEFCDVTAKFGHSPRTKSPAQVLAELDALVDAGWRGQVFFVDDNFIGNKRMLREQLLPQLAEWQERHRNRFPFFTEASINLADDEPLVRQLVTAGFDTVFVGIETPDDSGLAECHKVQNRGRDLVADIRKLQHAGLQVQGGFIVGFDSDDTSIFRRQMDFIQRSGIVTAMVGLLNALPGTRLHARLRHEGRLRGGSSGDNVDGTTNIVPRMGLEELRRGYRELLHSVYEPRHYYERVRTFLREFKQPRFTVTLSPALWCAFIRANVRLGIIGRERLQYWRLLIWTGLRRPALLRLAVTLAIQGHHFRRCAAAIT